MEAIIADADLEYWGSAKTNETAEKLFKELQTLNPQHTRDEWNKQQIGFLQNHQYFTNYCKALKEPFEQAHLKKLIEERNASVFK